MPTLPCQHVRIRNMHAMIWYSDMVQCTSIVMDVLGVIDVLGVLGVGCAGDDVCYFSPNLTQFHPKK